MRNRLCTTHMRWNFFIFYIVVLPFWLCIFLFRGINGKMCFFIVKWIKERNTHTHIHTDKRIRQSTETGKGKIQYNSNKWLKLKSNKKNNNKARPSIGSIRISFSNFILILTECCVLSIQFSARICTVSSQLIATADHLIPFYTIVIRSHLLFHSSPMHWLLIHVYFERTMYKYLNGY